MLCPMREEQQYLPTISVVSHHWVKSCTLVSTQHACFTSSFNPDSFSGFMFWLGKKAKSFPHLSSSIKYSQCAASCLTFFFPFFLLNLVLTDFPCSLAHRSLYLLLITFGDLQLTTLLFELPQVFFLSGPNLGGFHMCVCLYETCKFLPNLTRSAMWTSHASGLNKHPFSVIRVILLELVPNTLNNILGNTEEEQEWGQSQKWV